MDINIVNFKQKSTKCQFFIFFRFWSIFTLSLLFHLISLQIFWQIFFMTNCFFLWFFLTKGLSLIIVKSLISWELFVYVSMWYLQNNKHLIWENLNKNCFILQILKMTLSTILFKKIKIEHLSLKFREILTLGIVFSVEQFCKLIFSTLLIRCLGKQNRFEENRIKCPSITRCVMVNKCN